MAEFINIFDFRKIFVEYFLGTFELFAFAFVLILSYSCARLQVSNKIYVILLLIGSIMFSVYIGEALFFLILFVAGIIIFKILSKIVV